MLSPRWTKLLRDVELAPGRVLLMIAAIAIGMCALTTMLASYTILSRETTRNYLDTNPPSATLTLDRIDADLIAAIRRYPGIAEAQASGVAGATLRDQHGSWLGLTIFVVDDFNALHLNTVYREAGAWPPPTGTLLLEREALHLIEGRIGQAVSIRTANGTTHALTVSGTLHDPALPPANRGQTVYAYATPATIAALGLDPALHQLKLKVSEQPLDIAHIENVTASLALWLRAQGRTVEKIRIPPPGEHPHQKVMNSIMLMLLVFSGIALVLSAILTATILGGMLAQQTRQIGVMKTIGARTSQIAALYLTMTGIVGAIATALGIWAGLAAGRAFSNEVLTSMLNFTMKSDALPPSRYLLLALAGLLPLALAAVPIFQAARMTVQAAITDFGAGTSVRATGSGWLDRLPLVDRSLLMVLRNSMRRRSRLALTLALLGIAGAMVMSSLNVRAASEAHLEDAARDRHFDIETALAHAEPEDKIKALIAAVPGVAAVESWPHGAITRQRADGLEIERVYPDGAHGSLTIAAVPAQTTMLKLRMLSGRWLAADEDNTVVLNGEALAFYPDAKLGDEIGMASHGRVIQARLVGIAHQAMAPATAYVSPQTYRAFSSHPGSSPNYRIALHQHDAAFIDAIAGDIEAALKKQDINVGMSVTETMMRKEVDGHFDLLTTALLFIAVLMALVGAFGLGAAMNTNVAERRREFGIMRSIGASSGTVLRNVLAEGVLVGWMSVPLSLLIALPLSAGISSYLGNMLFGEPFPLAWSRAGVAGWLLLVTAGAALACALPAWRASRLSIQQTLSTL